MKTGKNQEKEKLNDEFKNHLEKGNTNHDDWDNDTYGHIVNPENLKKKNEPEQNHKDYVEKEFEAEEKSASDNLKNVNLSGNDDVASRNSNKEKGLGGKSI